MKKFLPALLFLCFSIHAESGITVTNRANDMLCFALQSNDKRFNYLAPNASKKFQVPTRLRTVTFQMIIGHSIEHVTAKLGQTITVTYNAAKKPVFTIE